MKDRDLRRALRELPRHGASDGFEVRLLERLDALHGRSAEGDRGRAGDRPAGWTDPALLRRAAAATVVFLILAGALALTLNIPVGPRNRESPAGDDPRADLAVLRAESERLQEELDELERLLRSPVEQPVERRGPGGRAFADTADPYLYLGGDDRYELVLDLERLAARGALHRGGRPLPASVGDGSR